MLPIRFIAALSLLLFSSTGLSVVYAEEPSGIGYETVEQVFDAMEANQDATRTDYGGWIVYNIDNNGSYTLWSITPEDHPANPTAIRRDVVSKDGVVSIQMQALCQAEKPECDKLIEEFKEVNAGIKQRMESGSNG